MTRLIAIAVIVLLAGCSLTPKPVTAPPPRPQVTAPSPTAMADCWGPVKLKAGPLTQQQAEIAWGVDDDHLIDCAASKKILANYIRKRDAGLAGTK